MNSVNPQRDGDTPRLRYYHFAAWILAAALLLLIQHWQLRAWNTSRILGQVDMQEPAWQSIHRKLTGVAAAGQFMIIAFGAAWRIRGVAVPCQPGHWLAILQAIAYASLMASQTWRLKIERAGDVSMMNEIASRALLFLLVWTGGIAFVGLLLAWVRKQDDQWRIVYALVALLMGITALPAIDIFLSVSDERGQILGLLSWVDFQRYVPLAVSASMFTVVASCTATDITYRPQRDWPHWIGVSLYLLATGLGLANYAMALES